jgi:hypothetical protein
MKRKELIDLVKKMIELSARQESDLVKISETKVLIIIKFIEENYHKQLFNPAIEDYPVYDENYLNECIEKSRLNDPKQSVIMRDLNDIDKAREKGHGKESYFTDPKGEGWPELEDDCAPD